jgi:hypothetical protein
MQVEALSRARVVYPELLPYSEGVDPLLHPIEAYRLRWEVVQR